MPYECYLGSGDQREFTLLHKFCVKGRIALPPKLAATIRSIGVGQFRRLLSSVSVMGRQSNAYMLFLFSLLCSLCVPFSAVPIVPLNTTLLPFVRAIYPSFSGYASTHDN